MTENITIPDYLLNDFTERADNEPLTPGEERAANQSIEHVADFCKWVTNTLDSQAKEMGYPGTGKVPPDQLGELYAKIAEKNLSKRFLAHTPEIAAASLTMGIIGVNLLHHRKQKLTVNENKNSENEQG